MNPLLESLARRGVDCTKGMKMEAPPLPEPTAYKWNDYTLGPRLQTAPPMHVPPGLLQLFTADQFRERDAYWMAKVEEAVKAERERIAQFCERYARRYDDIRRAALEMAAENIRLGDLKDNRD